MPIHAALALSFAGTLALAAVLLAWADRVAGARLLVLFLAGVATWIAGNELPTWFGPAWQRLGLALLATAPLTSAVFVQFCVRFCRARVPRVAVPLAYAAGASCSALALVVVPGRYEPFAGMAFVAVPNAVGWIASLAWAGLATAGHLVLARAFVRLRGPANAMQRRGVAAVCASSAWGGLCMAGYGAAALRLPVYPWPLLLLPAYPVILVYGILRYRVLVANAWARRAVAWVLLVGLATMAVASVPLLPLGESGRWLAAVLTAVAFAALGGPVRRLAERLVYPGRTVTAADLARWRGELAEAETPEALAATACSALSRHLGTAIAAHVEGGPPPEPGLPLLDCRRAGPGWSTRLAGWDAAPPGPRRVAELFGAVLAEEAARLERAALLAGRERERQVQARLAELGQLAATVAHDIRNPLNIISMAVAAAPQDTRREVAEQVGRIARLAQDLLDYAKPWHLHPAPLDLAEQARAAAGRYPGVALGPSLAAAPLPVLADAGRLQQALANLLDNAVSACAGSGAAVAIEAERGGGEVRLHVLDNGPGVPEELRAGGALFRPFASRAPGGTGLGLAIVAKVAEAHGGSVALAERPGWATCFTLALPAAP